MVSGKTLKRSTVIVVGSIIVLSILTMNVSYSSFFSVQTQGNGIQTISTGVLDVQASAGQISPGELMPTNEYEEITSKSGVTNGETKNNMVELTVTNNGDIDAIFGASIKRTVENESDAASLENVIIAIQKNGEWIKFGENGPVYTAISNLTAEADGVYPIIYDTINKKNDGTATTVTYDIYIWLKNGTPEDEQGKNINLSITAKSAPVEGQDTDNTIPGVKGTPLTDQSSEVN